MGIENFDINEKNEIHSIIKPEYINILKVKLMGQLLNIKSISPLGAEIFINDLHIEIGDKIKLEILISSKKYYFYELIIISKKIENDKKIIGFKWNNFDINNKNPLFKCDLDYSPIGTIKNLIKLDDYIYFKVKKISGFAIEFITSLRNKFFIPTLEIKAKINFPTIAEIDSMIKICSTEIVNIDNKYFLSVKADLKETSNKNMSIIGKYIFKFCPFVTLEELKKNNLKVLSTEDVISFSFVENEEDFYKVLELRHLTYTKAGKLPKNLPIEDTSDNFDKKAKILVGKYKDEIVASLRLFYPDSNEELEQELYTKLPSNFPDRKNIVEITRVCVHPDFRGSDILYNLFKQSALLIIGSNRRFVVGSSVKKLLPMYKKVGFKFTNISYIHTYLLGEEDNIFLGDAYKVITGNSINPLVWEFIYSDVYILSLENKLFKPNFIMKLNAFIYRILSPISKIILKKIKNKK